MTLLIQDFLKTNSINDLKELHGVEASFSKDGTIMSLNYSQIDSKNSDKLACQCRGIILARRDGKPIIDLSKTVNNPILGDSVVVSYGFDRFFNQGQEEGFVNLNDPNLKVLEKLDGTCIFLYYYNGWKVATRSVPEANIKIDDIDDFSSLFKKAIKETIGINFDQYTNTLDKNITYVFELMTPKNMIVVVHDDYTVKLIGARNKVSFKEIDIFKMDNLVPKVEAYSLKNLDEIITFVNSRKASEHEGVVLVDSNFNRVKIKNAEYVLINRARDRFGKSDRAIVEIILLEKEDDAIPVLPKDIAERIVLFKDKIHELFKKITASYNGYILDVGSSSANDREKRKHFAALVNAGEEWANPFFDIYSGKSKDIYDFIKNKCSNNSYPDKLLDTIITMIKV